MISKRHRMPFVVALALPLLALALAPVSMAQDKVVAKVNGKNLTESDLKYAEAEIGADIGNLPEATRRRVLVEYLIENQLFADAAETQKLGSGTAFDERLQYWRRRALRETYFDTSVKSAVSEADARKLYDEQVAQIAKAKPEEEVKASHILVKEEDKAKEIVAKLKGSDDKAFAEAAKANSLDPGSKDDGGSLGYFGRGQMVPQFEEAASSSRRARSRPRSRPSSAGTSSRWNSSARRRRRRFPSSPPSRTRWSGWMVQKAPGLDGLRSKAQLEYVDPDIKKQVEAEKSAPGAAPPKQ